MTLDSFTFPDWIEEFQIGDDVFGSAYEATLPPRRAWMKKTIAQVYAVNSPDSPQKTWVVNTWKGGFETEVSTAPLDCVVMLVDQGATSAVRILAALTPALAAGVKNILVVFTGEGELSQAVLTGFELAGQEAVISIENEKCDELLSNIKDSEVDSAILDLRSNPTDIPYAQNIKYWRAPVVPRIAVCLDEDGPDMDILSFAHPDAIIEEVSIEDLAEFSGYAVVVPAELVGEALVDFKLVLSHGQEGCWIWSDLTDIFFKKDSVALAVC
ncbi:histidinol dehydrogenase [Maridesulfovibrio frigidus]|uniref:histidinol dehydrogenase n=1 Tax=Maridesulfovibrio frigidus TaxID=340956 RepID=UPI0004E279CE|nr:histidinol dehydrogenase [Maridesulfovibrio frigidus]